MDISRCFPDFINKSNNSDFLFAAPEDKFLQEGVYFQGQNLLLQMQILSFNPNALRKAKIVCNFGLSECNMVKS